MRWQRSDEVQGRGDGREVTEGVPRSVFITTKMMIENNEVQTRWHRGSKVCLSSSPQ